MWQQLIAFLIPPKKAVTAMQVPPAIAEGTATIAQCQQLLLSQLQSGEYVLSSSDKEGHRTLCYYRRAFLYAEVGDDGTSLLRLANEQVMLDYVWRSNASKLVQVDGNYQWSYDLTEEEKLERWQAIVARLTPFTAASKRFVAQVVADFAALERE
ncbi:hypothetical protein [Hymenobacter wooponensis]|uniref:Uncharacterized protein n=1 Tax=Hymenobacter wooponensis TaxID=1525360 RepID=A0A4Z0MV80_9BACT|nr:hypothetical protein [Hymenobacter wooponensis]TGD83206.1 hypothetical protein EU557_05355 [Hymenobacter wooponensis]